jgi:hypothetical protein
MYILAGFLAVGFVCNALVRAVPEKFLMKKSETTTTATAGAGAVGSSGIGYGGLTAGSAITWILIAIPIAWGVSKTLESAVKLFQS